MKQTLYTLFFSILFLNALVAQTYNVTNLRVIAFSHNFQCGSDGFFSDPEPNFRTAWRVPSGNYTNWSVINPGAGTLACGTITTSVPFATTTYSGTSSTLEILVESWEDDDCGSADTFDDDCTFNDDENYGTIVQSVSLSPTGSPTVIVLSNGSTVTVAYDLMILPVELTDFNGENTEKAVELTWATIQEENSFEFEVQRSLDGREFKTIDILAAAGNSDEKIDYAFVDEEPLPHAYYRLKIVDLDGYTEYSEILLLRRKNAPLVLEKVYPNPTQAELTVQMQLPQDEELQLFVTDIMGRRLINQTVYAEKGRFDYNIDVLHLADGQYFISVFNGEKILTERFMKGIMQP